MVKGTDPYALAVALEATKFTCKTRLIIMSDQENAVKNLVDMIRDSRTHETAVISTQKGSSASAGRIDRANYDVEKQIRALRSRIEENYGESVGLDHKMLPFLVRHGAWLKTHCLVKSDGKTPYESLCGRPYQGQVAEFAEVFHFKALPGELHTCPSWTTDETQACGWERAWRQTSTMWGLQQEFAGVDPSGGAQRNNAWTARCWLKWMNEFCGSDVGCWGRHECKTWDIDGWYADPAWDWRGRKHGRAQIVFMAATPGDQGKWTQRVIDWDKQYYGATSGTLLDTQVYEGRLRELANIEKLELAEPIQLQEATYVYSESTTTEGCHGNRPNEHNTWAVVDMQKIRSVDQSVSLPPFVSTQSERARAWVTQSCCPSFRGQNKCVCKARPDCMHSHQESKQHPDQIIYGQNSGQNWEWMRKWKRNKSGHMKNQISTMTENYEESTSSTRGQGI